LPERCAFWLVFVVRFKSPLKEAVRLCGISHAVVLATVTTYAQQTEKKREPTEDIEEASAADKRLSLDSDKSFTAGLDISGNSLSLSCS
jgi:hypothetical protein